MAYLYRHMRLDKNEVFYIGIGSDEEGEYKRAFSKHNRSFHWKNITIKTDYQVEIILDDLTWEEACLKEIEFIKLYGRKDLNEGTLINLTDGGDGALGLIFSETHKKKIGESNKGKHSDYIFTEEHKKKLSDSLKGHKTSQETREKISRSNSGKIRSEEAKKKMSNASLGNKKRLGKKHSEETKKKMSEKALQRDPKSIQRMAETKKGSKNPRAKKVDQYSLDGKFIKTWSYITEAMEKLNIFHIEQVCLGKRKTAGGYIWKYNNK